MKKDMKKKYYKTNEFAALCGVTRHTLYHYEEIGLLCPKTTAENGYRFYTMEQYEKFLLISAFKKLGTPLKEIQSYFENQDTDNFLAVLQTKLTETEAERIELKKMCTLLSDTISTMKNLERIEMDTVQIAECEEQFFIATPAPDAAHRKDDSQILRHYREHLQYCSTLDCISHSLGGEMVLYENIVKDNYLESFYISRTDRKAEDPRLHCKPKGTYAIVWHNGSYDSLYGIYRMLKEQCAQLGYVPAGNIYQEDVLDFCADQSADGYVMKISMQVKAAESKEDHSP